MKKVRMIVSAFAVVAVVGSALAFSEARISTYCARPVANGPGTCQQQLNDRAETTGSGNFFAVIKGTAACTSTQCPQSSLKTLIAD